MSNQNVVCSEARGQKYKILRNNESIYVYFVCILLFVTFVLIKEEIHLLKHSKTHDIF